MFENKYMQRRIQKANTLKELGINPYSNKTKRDTIISKFLNANSDVFAMEDKRTTSRHYTVAGRIKFLRIMGKASFAKIEDESGILQIYIARDNLPEGFYNNIFKKQLSLSIGLALLQENESPERLLYRADQAAYKAKKAGGDRIVWAEEEEIK